MAIKVNIHVTHRQFVNGLEAVEVNGSTVGECLNDLIKRFPGMEKALFAGNHSLLRTVEIYVNQVSAYPNELLKPVKDGDDIYPLVMLSGG